MSDQQDFFVFLAEKGERINQIDLIDTGVTTADALQTLILRKYNIPKTDQIFLNT